MKKVSYKKWNNTFPNRPHFNTHAPGDPGDDEGVHSYRRCDHGDLRHPYKNNAEPYGVESQANHQREEDRYGKHRHCGHI